MVWLVWLVFPIFTILPPVRVALCFLLLLDHSAWTSFLESCREMLSMDPVEGTPTRESGDTTSALHWLAMDSVISGRSSLQTVLVLFLNAQCASQEAKGMKKILPWMVLISRLGQLIFTTICCNVWNVVEDIRNLTHARRMFQKDIKGPRHGMF
ncbi:hypothetical protein GGU11DRAFT_775558 [Lentinula aff. detonsa]|nr:hypothetical protein GGU11DRAFT_775558 [Lentinula aff. detonsa]